jgi:hypothetical protein
MDQQRFDRFTRSLARGQSRRGVLGGLTAALALFAVGQRAAADPAGYLGPGEECTDSSQCADTRYNSMSCDDNGTSNDGTLNCCGYEYGYCWDDDGCCGNLICSYGSCSPPNLYGVPLQGQCFSDDQCLDENNGIICGDNGSFTNSCCVQGGFDCTEDLDCCMPNNCVGRICQ